MGKKIAIGIAVLAVVAVTAAAVFFSWACEPTEYAKAEGYENGYYWAEPIASRNFGVPIQQGYWTIDTQSTYVSAYFENDDITVEQEATANFQVYYDDPRGRYIQLTLVVSEEYRLGISYSPSGNGWAIDSNGITLSIYDNNVYQGVAHPASTSDVKIRFGEYSANDTVTEACLQYFFTDTTPPTPPAPPSYAPSIDTESVLTLWGNIYPTDDIGNYDVPFVGYEITNPLQAIGQNDMVNIVQRYTAVDENNISHEYEEIVHAAIADTYYYVPLLRGGYYGTITSLKIAFASEDLTNTNNWTDILSLQDGQQIATQGRYNISVQGNEIAYDYGIPQERYQAGYETAQTEYQAALGIYSGMDIVSGVFSKIGEMLNIKIFGNIPLYIFLLIPLVLSIVYVVLKFVR